MTRPLNRSAVLKELTRVGEQLAKTGLKREKRMELLRRQAALGDVRDALAQRARDTSS